MPHRYRKIRKKRGSRTCGWGQVGQHRASGARGGHGISGMHKGKWTQTVKLNYKYFGKHGFNRPITQVLSTINIRELEIIADGLKQKNSKMGEGGMFIDLSEFGIGKLLGSGKVTRPLVVTVQSVSKSAARKVRSAGGKILLNDKVSLG